MINKGPPPFEVKAKIDKKQGGEVACFCFSDNPHVRTTHQMNNLPVILSS
jgi:hypothetical protein